MAFPPQGGPDEPLRREQFHRHMPLGVMQNSPHGNNVIIGDLTSDDFEHSLVPIFKVCQVLLEEWNCAPSIPR